MTLKYTYLFLLNWLLLLFFLLNLALRIFFFLMIRNKLSVNLDKTEYLLFNLKNINVPVSIIQILFLYSESAKNLGVIFQSDMSMDKHISSVVKTCFLQLCEFRHIQSFIPKSATISFTNAVIHSRINYYYSLLYDLSKYSLHRLQKVQNSVTRIVIRTSRLSHITPLLKSLHWLPVKYRINFILCCIIHRALSFGKPHNLNSLLILRLNPHFLCSSSFNPLILPFFNKMSNGFRSFAYAAPFLWNSFICQTLFVLRLRTYLLEKNLKTYFFNQAFLT